MYLSDPKTHQKSVSLTLMIAAFAMVGFKYLFEGLTILSYSVPQFDYAAATALLGITSGLYFGRKKTDANKGDN